MDKIVRVDLSAGIITTEPVADKYKKLGGRALTAQILTDEVEPGCEPLGKRNKLVFAPGLLGGSFLSSSSRLSVGGKSPLTGGIKEANAGGTAAAALCHLGIKALIIEGESHSGYSRYLYIDKDKMELRPAEMSGQGVYSAAKLLFERYGEKTSLILIGPGGERGYASAGITNTDVQGRPSRFCGRGGLGAVMGVKGLKAIVLDPSGADGVTYHDRKAFLELNKELVKLLKENPATGETYPKYGTAAMATRTNAINALPTRNFSAGNFECANRIDGEYLYHVITKRGGEGDTTHACMPGCVIKCSNIYADTDGKEVVAPLEYETIGLMGSNLGIGNLDDIARLNYLCNDLGLDTIEIGAAIGVAMDQGLIAFGDADGAADLLAEIGEDTILGKVLGHGALITGRVLGSRRIPVAKGQAMPAYDPRGVKGLGVTFATSAMGADHTAGNTIRAEVDHIDPAPQPGLSRNAQAMSMIADSMGLCLFVMPALGAHLDKLSLIYEHYSGVKIEAEELREAAVKTLAVEREFNRLAGLSPAQDRLPEFMSDEPLPVINSAFDVTLEELRKVHDH
jgi:aldehyde:ferredoxin oxidoreductase